MLLVGEGQSVAVAVALLCLALASVGCVVAGALLVAADLIPEYAGVAMGISNTFGQYTLTWFLLLTYWLC